MRHSASDFSDWVYQLRHPKKTNRNIDRETEKRRALGTLDHNAIELIKTRTLPRVSEKINHKKWKLYYVDDNSSQKIFHSQRLNVDGVSLKGRPDVIFSYNDGDYYIVVERKITSVPHDIQHFHILEPAQCQLWAYSWLDELANAKDVLLVLEIWERFRGGIRASDIAYWKRSNDKHNSHCLTLFEMYVRRNQNKV
jgi:hypothetical protein